MIGTARNNLDMFRKLCGDDALKNVVLGTTKWSDVTSEAGQRREQQLRDTYWKEMLQHGSVIMQVHADSSSAWKIVNRILENDRVEFVRIQEELLELQKIIPETDAGRTLRFTLKELEKHLSAEGNTANTENGQLRQRLDEVRKQIQKLQVPLSERIKRFIGLK